MPDEDIQTKYYNKITWLEEWRCRYYATVYLTSGSISGPQAHLEKIHEILRNLAQDIQAKNVQQSLQAAFIHIEANPHK
jgi:hypothetical protein